MGAEDKELVLPVIVTCPVGHEDWPMTSLKTSCDTLPTNGKHTLRTVHFLCPAGHVFDLGEAVKAGMLNRDQARNIKGQAQALYVEKVLRPFGLVSPAQTGGMDAKAHETRDAGQEEPAQAAHPAATPSGRACRGRGKAQATTGGGRRRRGSATGGRECTS